MLSRRLAKRQAGQFEEAVLVRAAMDDGVGHGVDGAAAAPAAVARTGR